jgi:hypothetical protein
VHSLRKPYSIGRRQEFKFCSLLLAKGERVTWRWLNPFNTSRMFVTLYGINARTGLENHHDCFSSEVQMSMKVLRLRESRIKTGPVALH